MPKDIYVFLSIMWRSSETLIWGPLWFFPTPTRMASCTLMSWHRPNCHQYEGNLDLLSLGLHNLCLLPVCVLCQCLLVHLHIFRSLYAWASTCLLVWTCLHACLNMHVYTWSLSPVYQLVVSVFLFSYSVLYSIFTLPTCEMAFWIIKKGT